MDFDTGRRRFLEIAGAGTAVSLAGCSSLQNNVENGATPSEGDGTAAVTIAVQADQQKLEQHKQKIQSELQAGNISRRQAQQQFRRVQDKLRSDAVASVAERVNSNESLTIEDSIGRFGVLLVSGSADALIETLSFTAVNALLSEDTFQQAKDQLAQQPETTTSPSE